MKKNKTNDNWAAHPPLEISKKSPELRLSSLFPQEKVTYLISKEHFKLRRVPLLPHCSFPSAASNIVGFFSPISFPCFLPFYLTFLALQYLWSRPGTLQCANCGQQDISYQSKQVPSLHTLIFFFWLQSSQWFGRQEHRFCTLQLIFKATSVVPRAF